MSSSNNEAPGKAHEGIWAERYHFISPDGGYNPTFSEYIRKKKLNNMIEKGLDNTMV